MSSRFVRGWKASPKKLLELVGTKKLTAKTVLAKANKKNAKDVFMTLGQGYDDESAAEGKTLATEYLTSMLEGKLDKTHEYGRVIELVLDHAAEPMRGEITLMDTYHLPSDDQGCWNPLLRALKLPTLAKAWAAPSFSFPRKTGGSDTDWPVWTEFAPKTLAAVADELEPLERASLDILADKLLGDDPVATRDELWDGLQTLATWVDHARRKPEASLVLVMDGDQ